MRRRLLSCLLLALTIGAPHGAWAQSSVTGLNTMSGALPIGAGGGIAMTVLSSGNVGIGTTTPIQKFVISNGGAEGIEFNPIREGANTFAMFATNRSTGNPVDLYFGANAFHFDTPIDSNERLTITSTGNVGIGTTAPQRTLDIGESGQITFNNDGYASTSSPGIFWSNDSVSYGIYKTAGSWSPPNWQQLELNFATGIIIDGGNSGGKSGTVLQPNGGGVGIGMTPTATLDVNGGIRGNNSGTVAGQACSPEGMVAYDMTNHQPVYCTSGGVWGNVNSSSAYMNRTWTVLISGVNSTWTNYGGQNTHSYPIDVAAYFSNTSAGGQTITMQVGTNSNFLVDSVIEVSNIGPGQTSVYAVVPPGEYWGVHVTTGGVPETILVLQ